MPAKLPKVKGLRRRWLAGSIVPVAAILLLVGVLISVGFASNYYNSARSTLRAKASSGADYFNTYVMTGYKEYYRSATLYAATFDDSDRIELQFLNSAGRVEVTTRGLTAGTYPGTPEIARAVESGTVQDFVGRDETTGERIIAASSLLKYNGQVVGVMRYVTGIGELDRQVSLTVLVVCGVMIGYICSALTDFLVTFADDSSIVNLHNWSLGSFSGMSWENVKTMAAVCGVTLLLTFLLSKPIRAYQLGEVYAQNMGVPLRAFRTALILLSSVLSACVTAFAGPISFVGIAVPHLMKSLFKSAEPLVMIPACFLGGGVFCLFCDLIARTAFAPTEVSISSVTAVFGAPIVIYMMIHRKAA